MITDRSSRWMKVSLGALLLSISCAQADLQRVNIGVFGGLANDLAAYDDGGSSRVFAAVECHRGVYEWVKASNIWSTVTYPDIVGEAQEIEANRKSGYEDDLYCVIRELDGQQRLFVSDSGGDPGTWVTNTVIDNPSFLIGHASGMYCATRDGSLYFNPGSASDAFILLHQATREIQSVAPVDTNTLYITLTFNTGETNLYRLTCTNAYQYEQVELTLPQDTPSGATDPRILIVGVAPEDSNRVFIAGSEGNAHNVHVFESLDGGYTWSRGWDQYSSGTNKFYGAFPSYIKFDSGRVFISNCALADGTNAWTYADGTITYVGTASGTNTEVYAHANSPSLEVDPIDSNLVYFSTDWGVGLSTCTAAAVWSMGVEVAANNGIAGVVLNDMAVYEIDATNKHLWIAAKSGIGRPLSFNPLHPGASSTPMDWIYPLYPSGSWGTEVTIHPTNPAIVLAGYNSGHVFRSLTATGESSSAIAWSEVFYAADYTNAFETDQNDVTISSIDFVPSTPDELYLSGLVWNPPLDRGAVFFSDDGGATWSEEDSGYPVNDLYVSDTAVWAGIGSEEDTNFGLRVRQSTANWWSPATGTPMDTQVVTCIDGTTLDETSTVYVVTRGDVYRGVKIEPCASGFSCWSWVTQTVAVGSSDTDFTACCVDPNNPDRAFVAAGNSIFRTTDGGSTWNLVYPSGLPSHEEVRVLLYDDLLGGTDEGLYGYGEALVHYVVAGWTNPVSPYTNWLTAADNIQDAVDVAGADEVVLVSNGLYNTGGRAYGAYLSTNRVCITNAVTVISVNGPDVTRIEGAGTNGDNAVRGVFLTGGGLLAGFTITNGHTRNSGDSTYDRRGGGIFIESEGSVSNCTILNNEADTFAGGVFLRNGGALKDCLVQGNYADKGGGAYLYQGGQVVDCAIVGNQSDDEGAGVRIYATGVVARTTIADNVTVGDGGGLMLNSGGLIDSCRIERNVISGSVGVGGGLYLVGGGMVVNSLIASNATPSSGGGVCLQSGGEVINCTVVHNLADSDGGGLGNDGGGIYFLLGGTSINSIVYYNTSWLGLTADNWKISTTGAFFYSCTTPKPTYGDNNTTNPPDFTAVGSDYTLRYASPCIDKGQDVAGVPVDLNGVVRPLDGDYDGTNRLDMGAFEYDPEFAETDGDGMLDAWEVQVGLNPTNAADAAWDDDGDGAANAGEYVAGTDPHNDTSVLAAESDEEAGSPDAYVIRWSSVDERTYRVLRNTNLVDGVFSDISGAQPANPPENVWTDTPPAGVEALFYRVQVERDP